MDLELSDKGQTDPDGMGMGLLRWLLWPRHSKREDDEEESRKDARRKGKTADPGVYRIEVDGEAGHYRGEGPPFSFWGSSRIILILSFLLWWIQPAGPMIAGYVGGRRAGSPMKAVVAALLPVVVIFAANAVYSHNVAAQQIDFVASLPNVVGDGAASILPFLAPYKEFLVAYMIGFVRALQSTFGMGTNGYLMVIIFSYIGGLIAEQTRRELYYRQGATQTVGLNLVQPFFGGRHHPDEFTQEDDELQEMRHPTRVHARAAVAGHRSRRHGIPDRFDDFRSVSAETLEGHATRRASHARARDEADEEEETEAPVRHASHERHEERRHREHEAREAEPDDQDEEDSEAVAMREAKERESRRPRMRTHEEEIALQRFVERALRNYDHSKV